MRRFIALIHSLLLALPICLSFFYFISKLSSPVGYLIEEEREIIIMVASTDVGPYLGVGQRLSHTHRSHNHHHHHHHE